MLEQEKVLQKFIASKVKHLKQYTIYLFVNWTCVNNTTGKSKAYKIYTQFTYNYTIVYKFTFTICSLPRYISLKNMKLKKMPKLSHDLQTNF